MCIQTESAVPLAREVKPTNSVVIETTTPKDHAETTHLVTSRPPPPNHIPVQILLYTSTSLVLLQTVQFGWSLGQLNLSTFHTQHDCDARPVVQGTCLMFPGHTKAQWTWIVNIWVMGGMVGALFSGPVSNCYGRKTTMLINCFVMALGAIVQASASSITMFTIGRAIAGIASGVVTAMPNGYISEIGPPHLRNKLGVGYQMAIATGLFTSSLTFFVANTTNGWRYIAAFPIVLAVVFVFAAPPLVVESPVWLLAQGRQDEAERELCKLYGADNLPLALSWMRPPKAPTVTMQQATNLENPWKTMFSPAYRLQIIIAVCMALALQFSGINAVFMYSSSMFKEAGISDGRIGSVIVNGIDLFPSLGADWLAGQFGNRTMLLWGQCSMVLCAMGLTIALLLHIPLLSIVFLAMYVAIYSVSLGSLAFVVAADVIPPPFKANGTAITLFANWIGSLLIGTGYPYIADAFTDLKYVPFILTVTGFTTFMYLYLPETSGRTSHEIQFMFSKETEKHPLK